MRRFPVAWLAVALLVSCRGGARCDADGDGFSGDPEACRMAPDCDDDDPDVHPTAPEVCNERDDDCNGLVDDGVTVLLYEDLDDDGYGAGDGVEGCEPPAGWAAEDGDCDAQNPDVHPGADEIVNGIDDDCDRLVDCTDPDAVGC